MKTNKIGFKSQSYKQENYQLAPLQDQNTTEKPMQISERELLQQLGWEKAMRLLQGYLSKKISYEDVFCKELSEIRKHFF